MATEFIFDASVRRQIAIEQLKASLTDRPLNAFLRAIQREFFFALLEFDVERMGQLTVAQRRSLQLDIRRRYNIQRLIYQDFLMEQWTGLSEDELEHEVMLFDLVLTDIDPRTPDPERVFNLVGRTEIASEGERPLAYFEGVMGRALRQIGTLVGRAATQNWSVSRTQRAFRGTPTENGVRAGIRNGLRAAVNTVTQHVHSVSREAVWQFNRRFAVGYVWVSILDERTTNICRSLDGREFLFARDADFPRPPIHTGCRSTTAPILRRGLETRTISFRRRTARGTVPANTTYYEWLRTQDAAFQDSILGPTRGKLFRNGGLTPEEFARLNLNRNFEPRTLEQMRRVAPNAFRNANID